MGAIGWIRGAFSSDDPEDVISELQNRRILARADHVTIEGGQFSLSHDELQQSRGVPWLPRSVEDRIARDAERTKRIINAYQEHVDGTWPTLIFATSVEHSQTIAALLTSMGVRARAVSGSTRNIGAAPGGGGIPVWRDQGAGQLWSLPGGI